MNVNDIINARNNLAQLTPTEVLAISKKLTASKGPTPSLNLGKTLARFGNRLPVSDLDEAISLLQAQKGYKLSFQSRVADAIAAEAQATAASMAEAAKSAAPAPVVA